MEVFYTVLIERNGPPAAGVRSKSPAVAAARCMLGAALLALAAAGCPGSVDPSLWPTTAGNGGAGNPGTGGTGLQDCDPKPIFAMKICANPGCHDATGTAANFDMATADWQKHLVGVTPKGGGFSPSICAASGPYLAADTLPATGLFLDKVNPNANPSCGVVMPQVGAKLTASEFDCVQSWANALVMAGPSSTGGNIDGGGQ
jgi:hypothetical protein